MFIHLCTFKIMFMSTSKPHEGTKADTTFYKALTETLNLSNDTEIFSKSESKYLHLLVTTPRRSLPKALW